MKAVELIDESANRVSDDLRGEERQIPWRKMIGMRHILVHNYWRTDPDIVWAAVKHDLPPLIEQLEAILARLDDA